MQTAQLATFTSTGFLFHDIKARILKWLFCLRLDVFHRIQKNTKGHTTASLKYYVSSGGGVSLSHASELSKFSSFFIHHWRWFKALLFKKCFLKEAGQFICAWFWSFTFISQKRELHRGFGKTVKFGESEVLTSINTRDSSSFAQADCKLTQGGLHYVSVTFHSHFLLLFNCKKSKLKF